MRTLAMLAAAAVCGAGGCTVRVEPAWQAVEGLAAGPLSGTPGEGALVWERTEADAAEIRRRVGELLCRTGGLTRADAVRIALLGNPRLQAAFEEVGIAESDLVQARLFTNPSWDAILRLPLDPGSLETDLLFWLTDLWVVPARAELAERARDVTLARTAAAVAGVAAETSIAFDEVLFRTADRDLAVENLQVLSAAADRIRVRYQSGLANDFDVHQADARAAGQRIELAAADRELTLARTRLDRLMGLAPEQTGYAVADDLEDSPASRWTAETALAFALEHRLDLTAARQAVETAARNVEFQERLIVRRLQVGGGFEGNFRASNPGGPAVAMEIPLFDRNQAQIARAGFRLRQAQKTLAAMEQEARQEIVSLLADRDLHRTHVEVYRGRLAEARRKAVEFAERFAALMQLNWTFFFEARAAEVHARRGYLRALWGLRAAEADLHRALWGGVGRPHIGDLMPINPELTFRPPVTGGRQRGLQ